MKGFTGHVINYEERPAFMERYRQFDRGDLLSTEAYLAGLKLVELRPPRNSYGADPFILRDRWGRLLYKWPEDYEPSWQEVAEICRDFL